MGVGILLNARANPLAVTAKKFTVEYMLVKNNKFDNLCFWMERFPDWPWQRNQDFLNNRIFELACEYGFLDAAQLLMTKRVDIEHANKFGVTPLMHSVMDPGNDSRTV